MIPVAKRDDLNRKQTWCLFESLHSRWLVFNYSPLQQLLVAGGKEIETGIEAKAFEQFVGHPRRGRGDRAEQRHLEEPAGEEDSMALLAQHARQCNTWIP
mmetsp:Transcript_43489/g.50931  ORF Transcript_43489/g.50931 Transcript_43489/m.50931 type:complete len:100 (-) Transcript_43489:79-378(-)